MSAADHMGFLYINEKGTPKCFKIYMKHPVEFSDAWVNLLTGRKLDQDVCSSVEEIFHDVLFEKIAEALIEDGVATTCDTSVSGIKPLKGHIREDKLSMLEQIKLANARSTSLAVIAEKYGTDGFSGCSVVSDFIPMEYALEIRDSMRESQNGLLNCRESKDNEESAQVKIAMLMQTKKVER